MKGAFIAQPKRYKIDSREIKLAAGEGVEIKYNMKKGAGLIYSWSASDKLLFEFHGEPNVKPAGKVLVSVTPVAFKGPRFVTTTV